MSANISAETPPAKKIKKVRHDARAHGSKPAALKKKRKGKRNAVLSADEVPSESEPDDRPLPQPRKKQRELLFICARLLYTHQSEGINGGLTAYVEISSKPPHLWTASERQRKQERAKESWKAAQPGSSRYSLRSVTCPFTLTMLK